MTPDALVAATKTPISRFGTAYMIDPQTTERGRELGLSPLGFYYGGRGGVLGAVDADVVAAAFAFMPARGVRRFWEEALGSGHAPAELAAAYAEACADYGRRLLGAGEGLDAFSDAATRLVEGLEVAGMPLFAGWRALPRAADSAGVAAQLLNLLREHRGGLHTIAVLAEGLDPLTATLAGGGPDVARFLGWKEPFPEVDEDTRARRGRAEESTDRLVARAYAALTDGERQAIADGVAAVKEAAKAARARS